MRVVHTLRFMIELLRAFCIVVEEGSLNRAAERLHITQPSLTRQMQALENEIGGALLQRQSSGVKPTALGQVALASVGLTRALLRPNTSEASLPSGLPL